MSQCLLDGSGGEDSRSSSLGYAIHHWYEHAREVPTGEQATPVSKDLWKAVCLFFWDVDVSGGSHKELHTSAAFRRWVKISSFINGVGPLHIAGQFGLVDILKYACAHPEGLDFNVKPGGGSNPLMIATIRRHTAAVEILLSEPTVDINVVNGSNTPLMVALEKGHDEIAQAILRKDGVDVNHVNRGGESALDIAVERGCYDIVELLKAKGAVRGAQVIR